MRGRCEGLVSQGAQPWSMESSSKDGIFSSPKGGTKAPSLRPVERRGLITHGGDLGPRRVILRYRGRDSSELTADGARSSRARQKPGGRNCLRSAGSFGSDRPAGGLMGLNPGHLGADTRRPAVGGGMKRPPSEPREDSENTSSVAWDSRGNKGKSNEKATLKKIIQKD